MSGLNTVEVISNTVDQNTVKKISGYSWTCALGGPSTVTSKGIRRFELHVVKKTGALQLGVFAVPPAGVSVPDTWSNSLCVDRSWFVTGSGDVCAGSKRVMRCNKRIEEDDVVGLEVDLDHGIVTFRKLPASRRRKHVFGAFCEECGEERCREWNKMDEECSYGYIGIVPKVMCYKHRLVLGNLPVGHIDGRGEWRHPNGRLIADIVMEFMKLFTRDQPEPTLINMDYVARSVTVELPQALAVDERGKLLDSPIYRVLQVLVYIYIYIYIYNIYIYIYM